MGATFEYQHPAGTIIFYAAEDALSSPPRMAWIHPTEGPVNIGRVEFSYPGAEGIHQMRLGKRMQMFTLAVVAIATGEAGLEELVTPCRERTDGQVGSYGQRGGVIWQRACELYAADFDEHHRTLGSTYLLYGRLVFRKLAPDVPATLTSEGATGGKWGGSGTA